MINSSIGLISVRFADVCMCPGRRRASRMAFSQAEAARQSACHENALILQWKGGGSTTVRPTSVLAEAKETGWGAPSAIASTFSVPAMPWWPEINRAPTLLCS